MFILQKNWQIGCFKKEWFLELLFFESQQKYTGLKISNALVTKKTGALTYNNHKILSKSSIVQIAKTAFIQTKMSNIIFFKMPDG